MALLSAQLEISGLVCRFSANAHSRNVACRPIVLGSGVRHSLSAALSPTFLFLLLAPNSEARLAKSLPAICYMLRRSHTHTQTLILFFIPLHKKRGGMQPGFGIPRDVVGRRARRRALCYYGCLCRPSADMRYLITLTPPGNKKKRTRSVRMRVRALELRPSPMNMQEAVLMKLLYSKHSRPRAPGEMKKKSQIVRWSQQFWRVAKLSFTPPGQAKVSACIR
jgi:hypothetical protein